MPALGLTDHGVMNGSVEHYKACKAAGIKPIIGLEAYFVDDRNADAAGDALRAQPPHPAGLQPGIPQPGEAQLRRLPRGLLARQGQRRHGAPIGPLRGSDRVAPAACSRASAAAWSRTAPTMPGHTSTTSSAPSARTTSTSRSSGTASPSRTRRTRGSSRSARELGRPLVATADVHYLRREDYDSHAALLCVQTKSTIEQPKLRFDTNEFYLKSSEEMSESFSDMAGGGGEHPRDRRALRGRDASSDKLLLPRFPTPGRRVEPGEMLRELAVEGLTAALRGPGPGRRDGASEVRARGDREMGFESYFLIVWDFVHYAKERASRSAPAAARRPARSSPTPSRSPTSTRSPTTCSSSAS